MHEKPFDYESRWNRYAFPETGARFATDADLMREFSATPLNVYATAAGIPLCFTDEPRKKNRGKTRGRGITRAIVNDETENTLIFGETGSKKTRAVIRPLIFSLACRRESMVITDPKGELATDPKVRGVLDEMGYKTVFLDFRNFAGDGYNLFEYAFHLYQHSEKDKAAANIASVIHSLIYKEGATKTDIFWRSTSQELLIPIVHALIDLYAFEPNGIRNVNFTSLASAMSMKEIQTMDEIFAKYSDTNTTSTYMFQNAISGTEGTTSNVIASAAAYLQPFMVQPALSRMLSYPTFDADSLYENPAAIFIIVPDEISAYDEISGFVIDNIYTRLIDRFTREYQNRKPPKCRVNFVCDEFCNLRINDMGPKISACRSRDIRFYLACQSLEQLEKTYSDAAIIKGNCKNILFLQSSDPDLINYICSICGKTYITEKGSEEPLVTPEMLRGLKKTNNYKEALYIHDRLVYFARLADYDTYELAEKYASEKPVSFQCNVPWWSSSIRPSEILDKIKSDLLPEVFSPFERREGYTEWRNRNKEELYCTLEAEYDDTLDDEDDDDLFV